MKIFVLSLASDVVRREKLIAQLQAMQLEFEVFTAVDGRKGLAGQYQHLVDFDAAQRRLGRRLGAGEAACAISHSLIYEKIVEEKHPWALVLEDDVSVDTNLRLLITGNTYQNSDLLLLNHRFSHVWRFSKTKILDKFFSYRLLMPCWMTAAYIVSNNGARYLLKHSRPVTTTADWPGDITEIRARVCVPVLVQHPDETPKISNLAAERGRVVDRMRFFKKRYWRRWLKKRMSTRVA